MEYSDAVVATTISKVAQIEKDQLTHTHYIYICRYIYNMCVYKYKKMFILKKKLSKRFYPLDLFEKLLFNSGGLCLLCRGILSIWPMPGRTKLKRLMPNQSDLLACVGRVLLGFLL